jgi:hypothetical protein
MNKPTNPNDLLKHGTSESFSPADNKVTPLRPVTGHKIEFTRAINLEPPKSSAYLIKGIIEPGQVSIWAGPPGTGKTFLMLYMAHAIAQGRQVFGRRVRQAQTIYMALEGRGGIDKRVYALCKSMNDANDFCFSGTSLDLLVSDKSGTKINTEVVESLSRTIREEKFKLVIIDTLNLTLGGADENDNSMMGQLMKAAGEIAHATQCHIAFVAHTGKVAEKGTRGASSQRGNADMVVIISGDKTLKASSHSPSGKVKDGAPFDLYFELKGENLATDEDGDAITSCTVVEVDKPEGGVVSKVRMTAELQTAFNEICDLLATPGMGVDMVPTPGMSRVQAINTADINAHWIKTGRLDSQDKPGTVRKTAQRLRNKLRDLGKIGLTATHAWVVDTGTKAGQ